MAKKKEIDILTELKQLGKKFPKLNGFAPSLRYFTFRIDRITSLLTFITENPKSTKKLKIDALNNFIINLVTEIEVYFKNVIIEKKGRWNKQGYQQLLERPIPLYQAFELLHYRGDKKQITKAHIIADYNSFKNFDSINKTMSALTNSDFAKAISSYQSTELPDNKTLKVIDAKWIYNLKTLTELRNEIIHDATKVELSNAKVKKYLKTVRAFIFNSHLYFYENTFN